MMPECHRLSLHLLTRAEAVTAQKKPLFTAGAPSLSSNESDIQRVSQNKNRDAVKHDTSCMPRHSISFALCKNCIFQVEPYRMNKACLCDGGGLVQTKFSTHPKLKQELCSV